MSGLDASKKLELLKAMRDYHEGRMEREKKIALLQGIDPWKREGYRYNERQFRGVSGRIRSIEREMAEASE